MVKLYQFRLSARGRKVFKEARVRRRVLLGLVELLAGMLVSFSLVFKHGHLEAYCEESETGTLRRSIRKRASAVVGVPFERVWCDPVESEPHLVTLLRYNADQVVHHDLPEHPALFDGSYVQDMVGARALPGLRLRVAGAAPGFRVRQLYEWVGLPGVPIRPATDVEVRARPGSDASRWPRRRPRRRTPSSPGGARPRCGPSARSFTWPARPVFAPLMSAGRSA